MSDITMCQQEDCPKHEWCYRFNAPPGKERQSYFAPEFTDDGCDEFMSMETQSEMTTQNNNTGDKYD